MVAMLRQLVSTRLEFFRLHIEVETTDVSLARSHATPIYVHDLCGSRYYFQMKAQRRVHIVMDNTGRILRLRLNVIIFDIRYLRIQRSCQ